MAGLVALAVRETSVILELVPRGRRTVLGALLVGALLAIGACARGGADADRWAGSRRETASVDPRTGTVASPRVIGPGSEVPKGGGTYKLGAPYKVAGRWYVPREEPGYDATGVASWYGTDFHGRRTANGEIYDMDALTAAHPTLPLPSYAYVTNLDNGRTVMVRINDRGPYARDRIIDLSRQTARVLGVESRGLAHVRVRYAGRAPLNGDDSRERRHLALQPWSPGAGRTLAGGNSMSPVPPSRPSWQPQAGEWSPLAHRAARSGLGGP